jgi:hypothetical protein
MDQRATREMVSLTLATQWTVGLRFIYWYQDCMRDRQDTDSRAHDRGRERRTELDPD